MRFEQMQRFVLVNKKKKYFGVRGTLMGTSTLTTN